MTIWRTWGAVAVLTALAAVLRFAALGSIPPGLYADEAIITLLAESAAQTGHFSLYWPTAYGGYHPLIGYVALAARAVLPHDPQAVRWGVAAVSVLSVPLIFWGLREIFRLPADPAQATVSALWAVGVYVGLFSNQLISRLGFEVSFPAIFTALMLGAAARWWRTGAWHWAALAGLMLGLGQYTYLSARALIPALGVVVGLWWWFDRRPIRAPLALMALMAGLASLPLAGYFVSNPAMLTTRAGDTLAGTVAAGWFTLVASAGRVLAGLVWPGAGDALARHNLPGQPLFDPVLAMLFGLGAVAGLRGQLGLRAVVWLAASAALLIPMWLTMPDSPPTWTRGHLAYPLLCGLVVEGGQVAWRWLQRRAARWAWAVLGAAVTFSAVYNPYLYFVAWPQADLFEAFHLGEWQAAQLARARTATDWVAVMPPSLTGTARPTLALTLQGQPVHDLPGGACVVHSADTARPQTFVVDVLADAQAVPQLQAVWPQAETTWLMHATQPWPLFAEVRVPAGAPMPQPTTLHPVTFAPHADLLGYDLTRAGDTLTLTLHWRARQVSPEPLVAFVHLAPNALSAPLAQSDAEPCLPATRWHGDEIIRDTRTLVVPPGVPLVAYVGWYTWPNLTPLVAAGPHALPDGRAQLLTLDP